MHPVQIAEEFGTPVYVYDRAEIRRAYAQLRSMLPQPSRLYYSAKANPHPDVACVLAELDCCVEVSSVGEIEGAAMAGFPAGRMLVTGPGKTTELVRLAVHRGVGRFSVESPNDLSRVGAAAATSGRSADCLLRINADQPVPGMGLSMTGTASQFGVDASWVLAQPQRFRHAQAARVIGLHLFMGTNIDDLEVLIDQFRTSILLAARLRSDLDLAEVDLGGGFASPYARRGSRPSYPTLRERLSALLDKHLDGWRAKRPLVSFESGRYLVGSCGTLVCAVVDVKVSKGRTFVVLDAGVHHLGGMSGLRRLSRVVPDLVVVSARDSVPDCVVTGPLCTPLDTWSDGLPLPELRSGDLVRVPHCGAYGLTASLLAFLGHPPAAEVVVDGDRLVSASRLTLDRTPITEEVGR